MSLRRRELLVAGGALGVVGLTGCDTAIGWAASKWAPAPDWAGLAATGGEAIDPDFHLLSRAAYGPRAGDVDRVRAMGAAAWLEEQLEPEAIEDRACELRARRFESLLVPAGEGFEFKRETMLDELTRATLLRAVYSERQLFEVMVGFWSDHLNVDSGKGDCAHLIAAYDRDVIRAFALGKFRDLIGAAARSPAMLVYLDGTENRRRTPEEKPNENYARELFELHTLGVDGGYSQRDVMEAARCLTGWSVKKGWGKGRVEFDPEAHDDGEKTVLGVRIPAGGGEADLERVLDIACGHAATARHVARKLVLRLVADEEPAGLVARLAGVFTASGGQIKAVLRELFSSPEFAAARGARLKTPLRFVASALRAVGAETAAKHGLVDYLGRLGQPLFQYLTPDGYPDEPGPWLGTLLWRWNFVLALVRGAIPGVEADPAGLEFMGGELGRAFGYLVGRAPSPEEREALVGAFAADARLGGALIMAGPAFQRC